MRIPICLRLLISLMIVALGLAVAQTTLSVGSVGGTIRDESKAVIGGAKVILTEESKGLVRESESDSAGASLFPSVIAGAYSVRVEKQGFSSGRMMGLSIEVGAQAAVEITLRVGEVEHDDRCNNAHGDGTGCGIQYHRFDSRFQPGARVAPEWPRLFATGEADSRNSASY